MLLLSREAMDKFKMQSGCNGYLTSRAAGFVEDRVGNKMCPGRAVNYVRNHLISAGHVQTVQYIAAFTF